MLRQSKKVFRPSTSGFPFVADQVSQIAEVPGGVFYLNTKHGLFRFDPVTAAFELALPPTGENAVVWNPGPGKEVPQPGLVLCFTMVIPTGLEPVTYRLEICCTIHCATGPKSAQK